MHSTHCFSGLFKVIFLCLYVLTPLLGSAQDTKKENIVEKIISESNGNIVIDIPKAILENVMTIDVPKQQTELRPGINKINGFRIQVFSDGRNQSTLEARAKARGNAILARFPKYRGQVYTYSSSPNWYTRVGNFKTAAEAASALDEIKSAFPSYASEMRVVKSQIVVIKQ